MRDLALGAEQAPKINPRAGDALLSGLTAEQQLAVCHGEGPLVIVAGPGAGKTRTLIHRVAWLLAHRIAEPWEILAVTFSVRAAGELRLRLVDMLGQQLAGGVSVGTFHSLCARMLREHPAAFGRTPEWTVYDQTEVRRVIDWLLSDRQRTEIQQALARAGQPAAIEVAAEISLAKNRLLTPDSYEQGSRHQAAALIAAVWRESERELQRCNAMDFDDLLVNAVRLLSEHPHRLELYRRRWHWLLIDEYQDTCEAQGTLIGLLAGSSGNICCVGDDDQVLYSFRGADAHGLAKLGERFPAHERVVLARNFRSHAEILSAAAACVEHNPARVPKALIAIRGAGGRARAIAFASEREEASWIAATVARALGVGVPPAEILLLARAAYASAPVQAALAQARIPHRVLGSLGLYERSEVRDALAYLTLIANPHDAQAFQRAIGAPRRGIGTQTAGRIIARARAHHEGDLIAASASADTHLRLRSERARRGLAEFGRGLERLREELAAGRSLAHIAVGALMLEGGLVRHHQRLRDRSESASERRDAERVLEDLRSLCRAAQTYDEDGGQPTLTGFLEHARGLHAQALEPGEEDRRITVSTIHRSKGTEAALVILAGCEERLLPSWRSLQDRTGERLAEERRLFYVACTRAKNELAVTHAAARGGRPTAGPSRFLAEAGLLARAARAV